MTQASATASLNSEVGGPVLHFGITTTTQMECDAQCSCVNHNTKGSKHKVKQLLNGMNITTHAHMT